MFHAWRPPCFKPYLQIHWQPFWRDGRQTACPALAYVLFHFVMVMMQQIRILHLYFKVRELEFWRDHVTPRTPLFGGRGNQSFRIADCCSKTVLSWRHSVPGPLRLGHHHRLMGSQVASSSKLFKRSQVFCMCPALCLNGSQLNCLWLITRCGAHGSSHGRLAVPCHAL